MEAGYQKIIPVVLFLGIIALIGGAMAIVNSGFGDTMTQCVNSSFALNQSSGGLGVRCTNSTTNANMGASGTDNLNLSDEYYIVVQGQSSLDTVSQQQPVIAIIVVMVIIIIALIGVFSVVGLRNN